MPKIIFLVYNIADSVSSFALPHRFLLCYVTVGHSPSSAECPVLLNIPRSQLLTPAPLTAFAKLNCPIVDFQTSVLLLSPWLPFLWEEFSANLK